MAPLPDPVTELAKQGNPQAIAQLINRSLQPLGITAHVQQVNPGELVLMLEAEKALAKPKAIALIQEGMARLAPDNIHQIQLMARRSGEALPLWKEAIALPSRLHQPAPYAATTPDPVAQSTVPSHPSQASYPSTKTGLDTGAAIAAKTIAEAIAPGSPAELDAGFSVQIQGDVQGQQVAIGDRNVQITNHGGRIEVVVPGQHPVMKPRPIPHPKRYCRPVEMIGRRAEISTLTQNLHQISPIEVYGDAGIGKTALMKSLAYHAPLTHSFSDGVIYRRIQRLPVADLVQTLFDDFYEYVGEGIVKPTDTEIRYALESKQAVVLLDDLDWAPEDLEELADTLPSLTVLAASTVRHFWNPNTSLELAGLPLPDALELFQQQMGSPLTQSERAGIESVCQLLQGHPLRLKQAAALLREQRCSLVMLVEQLQGISLEELILRLSAQQPEANRQALAVFGVMRGTPVHAAHLGALIAVPDVKGVLASLLDQQVIQSDRTYYWLADNLLQPIQQTWNLKQWTRQILSYFTRWVETQPIEQVALAKEALLQMTRLAIELGAWAEVLRLGQTLDPVLFLSKQWGNWERMLRWSLQAAQEMGNTEAIAWALHQLGTRSLALNDLAAAQTSLSEALRLREFLGDEAGAAVTRHNLNLLIAVQMEAPPEAVSPTEVSLPAPVPVAAPVGWWLGLAIAAVVGIGAGLGALWLLNGRQTEPPPELALSRDRLEFTEQVLNRTSDRQTVTLENQGTAPLVLPELILEGRHSTDFQFTDTCTEVPLPPGEDCQIEVQFTPQEAGRRTATLTLIDATGDRRSLLELVGTGIAAPNNITLNFEPGRLEFAEQEVGQRSEPQTITVTNTGTAAIALQGISPLGNSQDDFWSETDCTNRTLAPGETCSIQVAFQPTAEGTRTTSLVIAGQVADSAAAPVITSLPEQSPNEAEQLWNVVLSGEGIPIAVPEVAVLRLSGDRLAFGEQFLDRASDGQSVNLSNPGAVPVRLEDIAIGGENPNDFSIAATTCGESLAVGSDCTVTVRFQPQGRGDRRATLQIIHSATGGAKQVELSGTGIAEAVPPATIRSFSLERDTLSAGESTQLCYSVANARSISISGLGTQSAGENCITVSPGQDTTYTLTATGQDGQTVERSVRLTVAPAPLQPPQALTPGATNPENYTQLRCLSGLTLSWQPGGRGNNSAQYRVLLEYADLRSQVGRWVSIPGSLSTQETSYTATRWIAATTSSYDWRWTVVAIAPDGTESDPAPWHYFRCQDLYIE